MQADTYITIFVFAWIALLCVVIISIQGMEFLSSLKGRLNMIQKQPGRFSHLNQEDYKKKKIPPSDLQKILDLMRTNVPIKQISYLFNVSAPHLCVLKKKYITDDERKSA